MIGVFEFWILGVFITSSISLTLVLTAENSKKSLFKELAMILAKVVLPVPGGPHKISDGKKFDVLAFSKSNRIIPPRPSEALCEEGSVPTRFSWPTKSFNVFGLRSSGSGILVIWNILNQIKPERQIDKFII